MTFLDQAKEWMAAERHNNHSLNALNAEATAAAASALIAIADELRRLNEDRSQWYREVLEVLARAKDSEGSPVGSGQPAAAPDGQEGGEPR